MLAIVTNRRRVSFFSVLISIFFLADIALVAAARAEPVLDAAVYTNGKTYLFKGDQYWRLNGKKADAGYHQKLGRWQGLPRSFLSGIDAALHSRQNGKTYFFKGDSYIRITGTRVDQGYPRKIAGNWRGLPENFHSDLDAALFRNGHSYFFKGGQYVRMTGVDMDPGYPRALPGGWQLPGSFQAGITAAFDDPDKNYFFTETEYAQLSDITLDRGFPQSIAVWQTAMSSGNANARRPAPPPAPGRIDGTSIPLVIADRNLTELTPPPGLAGYGSPQSVILHPGSHSQFRSNVAVKRSYSLAAIRTQPVVRLGQRDVDFTPVLQNPDSFFNVAQRLRQEPGLVEVRADTTDIFEIEQGIVVRSFLNYTIKPGACSNAAARRRIAQTGVECFSRLSQTERMRAMSDPNSARYVADPQERARLAAKAAQDSSAMAEDIDAHIATLRSAFNDPARRAELEAQFGADDIARLDTMNDAQLADELVNRGETKIEQVMFVPRMGPLELEAEAQRAAAGNEQTIFIAPGILDLKYDPSQEQSTSTPPSATTETIVKSLGERVFLTGFTLGEQHEWKKRIEVTIAWCLFGCEETYYAELFAGFKYGFGLRFPIEIDLDYTYSSDGKASVAAKFAPINGGIEDYQSANLPNKKIFEGKEFVAEFGGYAGARARIPTLGSPSIRFPNSGYLEYDFTDGLPAPFSNGQFKPPAPGAEMQPMVKKFTDIDLIGGIANFGVAGGKVFPAIKGDLTSDSLAFTLRDFGSNKTTLITRSEQVVNLYVDGNTQISRFSIGEPVYDLMFKVTPGVVARLFVDVAVWSDHWDWNIWFPQLAIEFPPGGARFSCHEGTTCTRNYKVSPTSQSDEAGASNMAEIWLEQRANQFEAKWVAECLDEICETAVRIVRLGMVLQVQQKLEQNPGPANDPDAYAAHYGAISATPIQEAQTLARRMVNESKARMVVKSAEGWAQLWQGVWSKQCLDMICVDKIGVLAKQMVDDSEALQAAQPGKYPSDIITEILAKYKPFALDAIAESKTRTFVLVKPIILWNN